MPQSLFVYKAADHLVFIVKRDSERCIPDQNILHIPHSGDKQNIMELGGRGSSALLHTGKQKLQVVVKASRLSVDGILIAGMSFSRVCVLDNGTHGEEPFSIHCRKKTKESKTGRGALMFK